MQVFLARTFVLLVLGGLEMALGLSVYLASSFERGPMLVRGRGVVRGGERGRGYTRAREGER